MVQASTSCPFAKTQAITVEGLMGSELKHIHKIHSKWYYGWRGAG